MVHLTGRTVIPQGGSRHCSHIPTCSLTRITCTPARSTLSQWMGHCTPLLMGGSQVAGLPQKPQMSCSLQAIAAGWLTGCRLTSGRAAACSDQPLCRLVRKSRAPGPSRLCLCRLLLQGGLRLGRVSTAPDSPLTCPCKPQGRLGPAQVGKPSVKPHSGPWKLLLREGLRLTTHASIGAAPRLALAAFHCMASE